VTFEAVIDADGNRHCFADGCYVPEAVYDTLHPSKLFPVETGMTEAEALAVVERVKANAPKPVRKGPYFHTAIESARPLKSDALAVHTSQIPEVMARNAKHGLHIRYDRSGRPCFTDGSQRKKLMRIESEVMGVKIVKRNSYDGD
jgi:hypothetical protein